MFRFYSKLRLLWLMNFRKKYFEFPRNLGQLKYNLQYKCEVAKLGSKAGNLLSGKRGEWGRERERQRESKT
jgi:hypothetical protein